MSPGNAERRPGKGGATVSAGSETTTANGTALTVADQPPWPSPCPFDAYASSGLCVRCTDDFLGEAS